LQKKLFVGGLSYNTDVEEIRELFAQAGEVLSANIIRDKFTNQSRGFGFVEMATEEAAKKAIETLNGTAFMDRALSVAEAKPQEPREKRGGFGGSKGGYGGGGGKGGYSGGGDRGGYGGGSGSGRR